MKTAIAVLSGILLAGALSHAAHAQAQIGIPGVGQVTIGQPTPPSYSQVPPPGYGQAPLPGYEQRGERCEHLMRREHELREQVAYMPYGQDRARLEHRLWEVHEAREQCWQRYE